MRELCNKIDRTLLRRNSQFCADKIELKICYICTSPLLTTTHFKRYLVHEDSY